MIASFLDQDLYKFTTQQAVLQYFGDARATYRFINRNPKQCFNNRFLTVLQHNIDNLVGMRITSQELSYLDSMSLFQPWYLKYLESYCYQKQQLDIRLYNNALEIDINGPWHSAVLWEVPLMALISESFFRTCDTNWTVA
jgi:nicotinate phosphoribosyltransferase